MSPGLLADRLGPGGLKGRGTLGEPGRSRRCAPRARESRALPVTKAARDLRSLGPLTRQRRARTPQGATRPRSAASPGSRECRGLSGFLNPYLNTTLLTDRSTILLWRFLSGNECSSSPRVIVFGLTSLMIRISINHIIADLVVEQEIQAAHLTCLTHPMNNC